MTKLNKEVYNTSIFKPRQLKDILNGKMRKQQLTIASVEVDIFKNRFTTTFELVNASESRIYDLDSVEPFVKIRNNKAIAVLEDKFSFQFLSLSVTDNSSVYGEALFGGVIYIVHQDNGNVQVFSDLSSNQTSFTNLETGKVSYSLPGGNVYRYKGLAWTASNKRQKTMIFMEISEEDLRFELLNRTTLGAFAKLYNEFKTLDIIRDKKAFEKVQKAGGYVGNVLTGSVNLGKVPGYVRYYGDWLNDTNESFLTKAYKEAVDKLNELLAAEEKDKEAISACRVELKRISKSREVLKDSPTQDGQMYLNATVLAEMLSVKFRVNISPTALIGLMLQLRPGTIKASALVLEESVFYSMVNGTYELANQRGESIKEIGNVNNLLYIADGNCIKLDYNELLDITLEVLAFAKCSEGKLSKQFAETILYAAGIQGVNGTQLIHDVLEESMMIRIIELMEGKEFRLLTPEEVQNSEDTGFSDDFLLGIAPRLMKESKAFFSSVWSQAINSAVNVIDKFNAEITSHNRRLASDPTFILTKGKLNSILNTGESFINDRRLTKTVMIKYPKMGLREFYFSNNVSLDVIKERLNVELKNNVITLDELKAVLKFYKTIDSFVAVLPAKTIITYACAGLDFDYDGALFVEYTEAPKNRVEELTNEIVSLLENTKMKAVVIRNDK